MHLSPSRTSSVSRASVKSGAFVGCSGSASGSRSSARRASPESLKGNGDVPPLNGAIAHLADLLGLHCDHGCVAWCSRTSFLGERRTESCGGRSCRCPARALYHWRLSASPGEITDPWSASSGSGRRLQDAVVVCCTDGLQGIAFLHPTKDRPKGPPSSVRDSRHAARTGRHPSANDSPQARATRSALNTDATTAAPGGETAQGRKWTSDSRWTPT